MKRLVAIGDSITHGSCGGEPYSLVEDNFIKLFASEFNFDEVLNYGTNGTTVCTDTDWRPTLAMCVYIDEMFPAPLAIIAGGTNDYGKDVEIGNITDDTDKTFYGALKILFEKAAKRYEKVIVITPIKRKNEQKNKKGYTLGDYRNAIKKVASGYPFLVVDGESIPLEFDEHIPDGLHPNSAGHKIYAVHLIEKLKSENFEI